MTAIDQDLTLPRYDDGLCPVCHRDEVFADGVCYGCFNEPNESYGRRSTPNPYERGMGLDGATLIASIEYRDTTERFQLKSEGFRWDPDDAVWTRRFPDRVSALLWLATLMEANRTDHRKAMRRAMLRLMVPALREAAREAGPAWMRLADYRD